METLVQSYEELHHEHEEAEEEAEEAERMECFVAIQPGMLVFIRDLFASGLWRYLVEKVGVPDFQIAERIRQDSRGERSYGLGSDMEAVTMNFLHNFFVFGEGNPDANLTVILSS